MHFNPRPREGGDGPRSSMALQTGRFQSTPPRGGRRGKRDLAGSGGRDFNPRPREGGDREARAVPQAYLLFQSTPPRGGRRSSASFHLCPFRFQSTPPRGGRRLRPCPQTSSFSISIHAPARGATDQGRGRAGLPQDISIHAPARGATLESVFKLSLIIFQSTPPRGGRRRGNGGTACGSKNFNPRPREGGDYIIPVAEYLATQISIHAPARGATASMTALTSGRRNFNPRPREGGDRVGHLPPNRHRISIHAPARGATARPPR